MTNELTSHLELFKSMKRPPLKLFFRGDTSLLQKRKISIVGTRKPIPYTKQLTHELASKLSNCDICIVSGGAMGVDAIAHLAAKNFNTISVLANGLDIKYPSVNKKLLENIQNNALLLSAYEDGFKATRYTFVHRNELVVALGEILIVAQADENSGSLRSLEYALKMKKKVYTFAHRINDNKGLLPYIKKNEVEVIYDIDEFLLSINALENNLDLEEDEVIKFLKTNPTYEKAYEKFQSRLFEYELNSTFKVENGVCILCF